MFFDSYQVRCLSRVPVARLGSWLWFSLLWILAPTLFGQGDNSAVTRTLPISKVSELRALSPAEARKSLPVRIVGVITFFDRQENLCFIQDATGGTYFSGSLLENVSLPSGRDPAAGDMFEISGISAEGAFAPYLSDPNTAPPRYLGRSPIPMPLEINPNRFIDKSLEAQRVRISATVRSYNYHKERLNLSLMVEDQLFGALVLGKFEPPYLDQLTGARVMLTGVYGGLTAGDSRQLIGVRIFVANQWNLVIVDDGFQRAFDQAPVEVDAFLQPQAISTGMVHVHGVITGRGPHGNYFMRTGQRKTPLTVKPHLASAESEMLFQRGDPVQVAGIPSLPGAYAVLETAEIRRLEKPAADLIPRALQTSEISAALHGELVETEVRLIDRFVADEEILLLLNDGHRSFTATCTLALGEAIEQIPLNAWLSVTGILLVADRSENAETPAAGEASFSSRQNFNLWITREGDIEILQQPPFWTTRRLLGVLLVILLLLALSFVWTAVMRRRIAQQTRIIEMKANSERVTEERERIARELHDSIEQGMAAVGIQIDLARTTVDPAERDQTLGVANHLLRRTQSETRRSIQDLHDRLLDRATFSEALKLLASRMQTELNADIRVDVAKLSFSVPGQVAQHLLRIVQEGLSNSIHHAGGAIDLELSESAPGKLQLVVRDTGPGFDPVAKHPGHFGVASIRQRVRKINGHLSIDTAPGRGTCISVEWSPDFKPSFQPNRSINDSEK